MAVRKKNLRLSLVLFSIVVCFFFGIMLKAALFGHDGVERASVIWASFTSALV